MCLSVCMLCLGVCVQVHVGRYVCANICVKFVSVCVPAMCFSQLICDSEEAQGSGEILFLKIFIAPLSLS